MCDIIHLKNGDEIHTIFEFQWHFETNAYKWAYDQSGINTLRGNDCLCEINLNEFFKNRKKFKYECGDWWES